MCTQIYLQIYGNLKTFICYCESEILQSCPTFCEPMDCGLPGSSVHGIFQARVLEWVAVSFSRGSSQFRDQTHLPHCRKTLYRLNHQGDIYAIRDFFLKQKWLFLFNF